MTYPIHSAADFHALGYERRDPGTVPRIKPVGYDIIRPDNDVYFIFHEAGCEQTQYVALACIDDHLIDGMDGADAFRLGRAVENPKRACMEAGIDE